MRAYTFVESALITLTSDCQCYVGWWLRFKSFFTRGVPGVWPGEYQKAKVGITHERLCEEFHVALFSFQQVKHTTLVTTIVLSSVSRPSQTHPRF
jgi:hypothetical protein